MVHIYEYITQPVRNAKIKLICKTSDFIMALQSGWGFEDLKKKNDFKHFQPNFHSECSRLQIYAHIHDIQHEETCFGSYV